MKMKNKLLMELVVVAGAFCMSEMPVDNYHHSDDACLHAQYGSTVHITPNGKCYHSTSDCPTFSRSRHIRAVDRSEADGRRPCKVCH